jgi:hypothetical protein
LPEWIPRTGRRVASKGFPAEVADIITNGIKTHLRSVEMMSLAHALWDSQDKWDHAVSECAVTSLLELKNENWLADDEEEVTAEEQAEGAAPGDEATDAPTAARPARVAGCGAARALRLLRRPWQ